MRILIAVGCNTYTFLNELAGAEEDAQRIWQSLTTAPVGPYAAAESTLLVSPTLDQVRAALRTLPMDKPLDVLTFYFAGHGGVKSGSYYLCVSDSDQRRLSTTGLALGELLGVIAEFKPRQANLVIDACQSGGAMYDFAQVLHEEALEGASPLAISVLAACGSREGASETPEGGTATLQLLRYLNGDEQLQDARPFLDLIEIGRAVSTDLEKQGAQTPVVWGVNLTGAPEFVGNPHFNPGSPAATATHLPPAVRRQIVDQFGDAIAGLHKAIVDEASGPAIVSVLSAVVAAIEKEGDDPGEFVGGVTTSLLSAAGGSRDLLAPTVVIDSALAALLSAGRKDAADPLLVDLIERRSRYLADPAEILLGMVRDPHFRLLNHKSVLGDLYQLPIRVTGIMGWAASGMLVAHLTGAKPQQDQRRILEELGSSLLEYYPNAVVAMADEQAPAVYAFAEACRLTGLNDLAETVLACLYTDLVETRACVGRLGLGGKRILRFLQARRAQPHDVVPRLRANPSTLLSVVLLCAASCELDDLYDYDLIQLDHRSCNIFVPDSFGDLGLERIENGTNYGFTIGQSVWTLGHIRAGFDDRVEDIAGAAAGISGHRLAAALVASQVLPDRLPLFLSLRESGSVT